MVGIEIPKTAFIGGISLLERYIISCQGFLCFLFLLFLCAFLQNKVLTKLTFSVEFYIFLFFNVFTALFLMASNEFINTFLLLEMFSYSTCFLLATNTVSGRSLEAALKYFLINAFSSGLLIFSIFWIYLITSSTDFLGIKVFLFNAVQCDDTLSLLSLELPVVLILFSFLIKLAAFPFNLWLPDVYEGATFSVFFYLVVFVKPVLLFVFIKLFLFIFYSYFYIWSPIFLFSAVGSFLVGAFGAFFQNTIKKFFAFTSLNQFAFIFLALSVENFEASLILVFFFLSIYLANNFLALSGILSVCSVRSPAASVYRLADLKNIITSDPITKLYISLAVLSFIGLPPLAGFYAKFLILISATESSGSFMLVFIALFSNAVSGFYYLRLLKNLWLSTPTSQSSLLFQPRLALDRFNNETHILSYKRRGWKSLLLMFALYNITAPFFIPLFSLWLK